MALAGETRDGNQDLRPLQAMLDTVPDGVVIIDARGCIQAYNPACERLFGWTAAEVLGRNVKMLMPPPFREEHDGYLDHYHRTGERRIIGIGREVMGARKDGTTFPMELSVGQAEQEGAPVYVGIIRDLTERRQAETALREREARLASILETVPEAIIVIDERGAIESFSPAAERLFGYKAEEVTGRNVDMLMPSPYREQHDRYMSNYLGSGVRKIIGIGRVVSGRRSDGSVFPMELAVGEVNLAGRPMFTGFVRDLTERQATEKRMQELQSELLHVSRVSAMGQMSATLAHELNQPLTAVINYVKATGRLLERLGGQTAGGQEGGPDGAVVAKVRETMDKAASQAARAGQIIRRLRNFVEKGHPERRPESLNKVVEEASALALVGAKESNVRVRMNLLPDDPSVLIDKIQVQQVLLNLVRNAVEAMAACDRRELTIATAQDPDTAGLLRVTVSDTGPGLAPEVAAQLFQPFVTTKQKGMGLGLSICRSIIDAHGGSLWQERTSDGTAFHFTVLAVPDEGDEE
ncbi:PAS domain-containing sensor histidine kinase [Azospirillum sp. SYSU D00513]|uniref:PAS domain-containing sensor histidine kinase n=1 Tax=Azospirillum sp. SYSU D00513 TaxID=2812561 RepID=UPI001A96F59D|nr:PAS domain-containing sensor histidine kinase [Azospirillum sp. SYSU D00513]